MRAKEFVKSYLSSWNHLDAGEVAEHLSATGVYCDVANNTQFSHDHLETTLQAYFALHRHRYELVGDILADGETIAFRYRMFPLLKAERSSGSETEQIHGAEFITLKGNSAVSIHDFYQDASNAQQPTVTDQALAQHSARAKYAKSGLTDAQLDTYKEALKRVMQVDKAYLRSNLTLPELAGLVGCSVNHLSQVINAGFDSSFFDYVNQHRIEHAKALIVGAGRRGAVINHAFEAGFNSNSAFYTAFKKFTGQTPAQFRKRGLTSVTALD